MRPRPLGLLFLVLIVFAGGCRAPTPDERDNRRVLDAILTAITLKNARLLEDNAKRTEVRHDAGQLTDEEFQGMEAIISKARTGDWLGAELDGYKFRKQHPFVQDGR